MKKSRKIALLYGPLTLISLLVAMLGYAYTHKPFTPENLIGLFTALWQTIVAVGIIAIAGGIGGSILQIESKNALTRIGLDLALGMPILSIATLIIGSTIGVGLVPLSLFLGLIGVLFRKPIVTWLRLFTFLKPSRSGKYVLAIEVMAGLIVLMHLVLALAPPTGFDTLVYHLNLPKAYLQMGQIRYLPDNMFWGMPQNAEMLYLLTMRFAGVESATVVSFLIGIIAILGIAGSIEEHFGKIAAWTAVAALLAGESLTISLSSGYVEWTVILYGWAVLATLDTWFETKDRRLLFVCGLFCGAAISTKYTAGIILLGCLAVLAILPPKQMWTRKLSNILIVGSLAALFSLPWWLKNYFCTGNPFYPFFFPAGAMNEFRLFHYQNVPIWGSWKSVILLPWQATIWGTESKEGFSASIGAIFVGLSSLAWMGWKSRSNKQKTSIWIATNLVLVGFAIWAIGSRISGLLVQSRLFFGIFPAWALLAGVGMDAVWRMRAFSIRFGRVAGTLILLMLGFNLFATWTDFISHNPLAYVIRQEDQQSYLVRNMGSYANVMKTLSDLPASSHVLMLWEARGFACWPKCDADEVIDRWYDDINTYQRPGIVLTAWKEQGYTHLLMYQAGAEFVRDSDPRYTTEDWQKLESLLTHLSPPTIIGRYAIYSLK